LLSALVLPSLFAATLSGQTTSQFEDALKGLTALKVVVEDPGPDGPKCNVYREALELAAARPLLDGKLRVDPDAKAWMYVALAVIDDGTGCAAAVTVSARTVAMATFMPHRPTAQTTVEVLLWDTGKVMSGTKPRFGERVATAVRELVDRFVTKVNLANQ
jgi:hypothetical protein